MNHFHSFEFFSNLRSGNAMRNKSDRRALNATSFLINFEHRAQLRLWVLLWRVADSYSESRAGWSPRSRGISFVILRPRRRKLFLISFFSFFFFGISPKFLLRAPEIGLHSGSNGKKKIFLLIIRQHKKKKIKTPAASSVLNTQLFTFTVHLKKKKKIFYLRNRLPESGVRFVQWSASMKRVVGSACCLFSSFASFHFVRYDQGGFSLAGSVRHHGRHWPEAVVEFHTHAKAERHER